MTDPENSPADHLEGVELKSGWKVQKKVLKKLGATGSNFGTCYHATRGEEHAFVKAVDFRKALSATDFLAAVSELAAHAIWEKEVMEFCDQHGLSKIVRLHDHEYVLLESANGDPTKRISCLVMEIGKGGDLRSHLDVKANQTSSWKLHVIRDVALAIDQLHRKGIVHLDIKPSNVISMVDAEAKQASMKLGDMGRVVRKGIAGPFDNHPWPGDRNYQPPEKWYGFQSPQWNDERESADAFLLGSLLVFLFTGLPMTTLIYNQLPDPYKPGIYRGDFDQALIAVHLRAQSQVITTYLEPELPKSCSAELGTMVAELTHPDPTKRGDRGARAQGIVGIDRYHQRLLRIAMRLEQTERIKSK